MYVDTVEYAWTACRHPEMYVDTVEYALQPVDTLYLCGHSGICLDSL